MKRVICSIPAQSAATAENELSEVSPRVGGLNCSVKEDISRRGRLKHLQGGRMSSVHHSSARQTLCGTNSDSCMQEADMAKRRAAIKQARDVIGCAVSYL